MEVSGRGASTRSGGQQGSHQGVSPTTPETQNERGTSQRVSPTAYATQNEQGSSHVVSRTTHGTQNEQGSNQGPSIRASTQFERGSDEVSTEPNCEQCADDGQMIDATGFCTECKDYLCSSCVQQHQKLRVSKDHMVLTGQDMPHHTSQQCPQHPRESIMFYCQSENAFGCVTCFTVGHRECKHIGLISDLCKDEEASEELNEVQMAAKRHGENVDLYTILIREYRVLNANCYDRSREDFQSFRTDIETMLDQLGETVATEAEQLRDNNNKKLDCLSETVTALSMDMDALMSDINLKQKTKQTEQLFVAVKKNMKQIKETEHKLVEMKMDVQTSVYEFEADRALQQLLDRKTNVGGLLRVLSGDMECTKTINFHSPDDKDECYADGIVEISPDEIAVIDYGNTCLKQISLASNEIICKRELKSFALDVALIPESRLALTLPELHQLHFFTTGKTLEPCGSVDVDGQCLAVAATDDRLVVSYRHPPKVQIMDFEGRVQRTITSDASGTALFDYPRCLILSPKKTSIYISDRLKSTITSLSIDGDFRWVYIDEQLEFPVGVAIDGNGLIYVCSRNTHTIHVVSPSGVCLRIVAVAQFQLEYPKVIHYSGHKGALYVSNQSADAEQLNCIRQLSFGSR